MTLKETDHVSSKLMKVCKHNHNMKEE